MSSIEQMKELLDHLLFNGIAHDSKEYKRLLVENAIYVLQKRIREAEMLELQKKSGEIRSIDPKFFKKYSNDPAAYGKQILAWEQEQKKQDNTKEQSE